jgi:lipopolysaccharide transport system ATP-binding protein
MSSDVIISARNLTKTYRAYAHPLDRLLGGFMPGRAKRCKEFHALNNVSFDIKRGETVGIIGRNGSGKSTLLQLICGIRKPTSGTMQVNGRISALLELGAGFHPEFTGRENVFMQGAIQGFSRQEMEGRFDDITAFADIGEYIDQPVKTYSSGMFVRLAFAAAVSVEPDILVVDEALSVGDELFQRRCFSRIEAIKRKGGTILLVSHSNSMIIGLCDRAVMLERGEAVKDGAPRHVVDLYQKILFAPPNKIASILATRLPLVNESPLGNGMGGNAVSDRNSDDLEERVGENLSPSLQPIFTSEYLSNGASILKPRFHNCDGVLVNELLRGNRYRYCYSVKFDKDCKDVRFGMMVKTITGFPLGGYLSASTPAEAIPFVAKGSEIQVEFVFDCIVNPGVYFMNASVFGAGEEGEELLHRLVDAIAFRVMPVEKDKSTELINFNCVVSVQHG